MFNDINYLKSLTNGLNAVLNKTTNDLIFLDNDFPIEIFYDIEPIFKNVYISTFEINNVELGFEYNCKTHSLKVYFVFIEKTKEMKSTELGDTYHYPNLSVKINLQIRK